MKSSYWLDKNVEEGAFTEMPKTVKGVECCPMCGAVWSRRQHFAPGQTECLGEILDYEHCGECGFELRLVYTFSHYEVDDENNTAESCRKRHSSTEKTNESNS